MANQIRRQKLPRLKRTVFGPFSNSALRWGVQGPATRPKLIALRYVALSGLAARRESFEKDLGGELTFRGNTEDLLPVVVRMFGVWEPILTEFLRRRLTEGRVFVDVGANLGWFTLQGSRLVGPSGQVVAVEASPEIHSRLCSQVQENNLDNVRCINEAVSDSESWVCIEDGPRAHTGLTRVVEAAGAGGNVRARSLGEMLTDDEIARCRVIKIDVEGAEYRAVQGLASILGRLSHDVELVVEVGPERATHKDDVRDLFEILRNNGFCGYELPNDYSVSHYRNPQIPSSLTRMRDLPTTETDVVFSRLEGESLAF